LLVIVPEAVILRLVFWFWLAVGPALVLALRSLAGEQRRTEFVRKELLRQPASLPPVSVIVPVKGYDEGLALNLEALSKLDYPDYELLVVARTAADIPPGVLPGHCRIVLAQGDDPHTGEKVQNLMAGVRGARQQSVIYAFADSDGRVTKRWLRALVAALERPGVGAATGYRWFLPDRITIWTLLRASWDAVSAGTLGPRNNRFAWGGAMAIRKDTFQQAGVSSFWKNTISDDYALSAAMRAASLEIAYAPGALVPCLEDIGAGPLFAWMRRQMMITRFYDRSQWWLVLAAHVIYCLAMAVSVSAVVRGHALGWLTLGAQLVPGMWKGAGRGARARMALAEYSAWFGRLGWIYGWTVPVATWLWLAAVLSSAFGSTIKWRGYRYEMKTGAAAQRV
jgi:hypothetical protein